jgi:MFS family permease
LNPTEQSSFKAWFVVLVAATFFFYEFIQQNMFDAISSNLMRDFHVSATLLGTLSSFYFIANVLFLFIAGNVLDRFSTRRVILTALLICIVGVAGLGFSHNFLTASIARFLMGIGSAFCFLSSIRLASRWFPSHKMALVTGIIVTFAMAGGVVAQTPMTLLVHSLGWRHALFIDATFGFVFFALIAFCVQDFPTEHLKTHRAEQMMIREVGVLRSMRLSYLRLQNWLGGIYCCLMNLPIAVLGGLWGVMYLMDSHDLTKLDASYITSALFMGCLIGAPLAGWLSDKIGLRRPPMIIGAVVSLLLVSILVYVSSLTFATLLILFFLIGLTTGAQIISYALVAESAQPIVTAMSVSVVNISVMSGYWIFQPIFGRLMDDKAFLRLHHSTQQFIASDFTWAMWLFPAGFILALLCAFLVRETHCGKRAPAFRNHGTHSLQQAADNA